MNGKPKPREREGVGILEAGQCACTFLKFDLGGPGLADQLHRRFGNFRVMCGSCGETAGGQTDGLKQSKLIVWVKSRSAYFGMFLEVAGDAAEEHA